MSHSFTYDGFHCLACCFIFIYFFIYNLSKGDLLILQVNETERFFPVTLIIECERELLRQKLLEGESVVILDARNIRTN